MQCNGEVGRLLTSRRDTTETALERPAVLWAITSLAQARLHRNLPWPMALAEATQDGQAQSRGCCGGGSTTGLGFCAIASTGISTLTIACCLCFGTACGLELCAVVL